MAISSMAPRDVGAGGNEKENLIPKEEDRKINFQKAAIPDIFLKLKRSEILEKVVSLYTFEYAPQLSPPSMNLSAKGRF